MSLEPKPRPCGHSGCLLTTTKNCCSCEDRRPMHSSYSYYRDGKGVIKDRSKYARFWAYCPTCKYQLTHLREGRKRCACGLVKCDLTTEKCCICMDKRPIGKLCYKYVDGKGLVPVEEGRWSYYCPRCQARAKPKEPGIELPAPTNAKPLVGNHEESLPIPITMLADAPAAHLIISCTAKGSEASKAAAPKPLKESAIVNNGPDYDDVSDYEVIDKVEILSDKACQTGRRVLKKASRSWWRVARLR